MQTARGFQLVLVALAVLAFWLGALLAAGYALNAVANGQQFNVVLWIGSQLSRTWLNRPAQRLGGGFGPADDAQLSEFFGETAALSAAERDLAYAQATGQSTITAEHEVNARQQSLGALAPAVQERLKQEVGAVLQQQGLSTSSPLFGSLQFLWPPIAFAYTQPPYVLILSRRDRVELVSTTLLRGDLTDAQIQHLEADAERRGYSALVDRIGGVATYPSIVEEDDTYVDTLELISHEWTHQYLFFHPLGVRYFASPAMTVINETIANITGRELASLEQTRYPGPPVSSTVRSSAPPPDPSVNFDRTLHDLAVQVDSLLAQGKEDEAEQRMNDTQQYFAQHGYYIRKINQAYFAFYGTYANTPASTNPLGPQIVGLRRRYASIGDFVHAVQNVTSPADLRKLLAQSSS